MILFMNANDRILKTASATNDKIRNK